MKKLGIYSIINLINGKNYVGSSNDLDKRKNSHFNKLKRGKHENKKLQNSFNKYGEEVFYFQILEECERSELLYNENKWFLLLNPEFNILPIAGSPLGSKRTEETKLKISNSTKGIKKKPMSEETKIKLSLSVKGFIHTDEAKRKISIASKRRIYSSVDKVVANKISETLKSYKGKFSAVLSEETVKEIRNLFNNKNLKPAEISKILGINRKTIAPIVRNKTYRWVE